MMLNTWHFTEVTMSLKHGKRLFCLLIAALMWIVALSGHGETYPYVAYATDSVRLRGGASSNAAILTVIRQGDAVLVTGAEGNYKIVEYEGRKGYVVSSFLGAATSAASVPDPQLAASYPLLSSGSEGFRVKALQEALQELGFYNLSIDSKYGSGTNKAVGDFQAQNKLERTGVADAATQQLLFEGRPLNKRGRESDVKTLPPIPGTTIHPGDRGDAVVQVQQTLTDLKLYTGKIDGEYGSGTQEAVKAFQRANRLKVDGIIGTRTFAALDSARADSTGGQPTHEETARPTTPPSAPYVEPELPEATYPYQTTAAASVNLRKRASTSAMRLLTVPQGASIQVLEDSGNFLKVSYRNYTGYAAKDFINIPEQYLEGKVLSIDQSARVSYATLAPGAEGRAVRALQHALTELGYYNAGVDGKFGAGTTAGLKALQKKNGLRETGVALPELQQLIFEKRVRNSRNRLVYTKTLPPLDNITMQQGDFGDAVYELHQLLIATGQYDSNPGYEFTRATTVAVRAFQQNHKIKVTGKVDAFTLLAIRTAAKVDTGGPTEVQPTQPPLTADNVVIIRDGTRGLAVTQLQARLVELNYYSISPDGVYNADDIAAVRHFQRVNGLPVTGVADLATQQTLFTAYALAADPQATQPGVSGGALRIGAQGEEVRALQSRLVTLNYLSGRVDGIFGTQTAAAVTTFQRMNNLDQDGIAGSQTLGALYQANARPNQTGAPTAPEQPQQTGLLKVGSTGGEVVSLQQRLIALNYLTGSADGIYGPRTFLAVKEFQAKNKMEADGIAGSLTLARINSREAIANTDSTLPPPTSQPTQPVAPVFTAPRASEVRYANWYTDIRPIAQRLRNVVIYDFMTGEHYNFRFFSLGKHADGTTLTAADTATMNKVLGARNWTPRPVWVIFSDGRVFMGSTHSHPHQTDYIAGNDLNGHLCVHFPREMAEAEQTGPYAVSHQNAILAGWDLTQNMARGR